jgi:hypothetical protein
MQMTPSSLHFGFGATPLTWITSPPDEPPPPPPSSAESTQLNWSNQETLEHG